MIQMRKDLLCNGSPQLQQSTHIQHNYSLLVSKESSDIWTILETEVTLWWIHVPRISLVKDESGTLLLSVSTWIMGFDWVVFLAIPRKTASGSKEYRFQKKTVVLILLHHPVCDVGETNVFLPCINNNNLWSCKSEINSLSIATKQNNASHETNNSCPTPCRNMLLTAIYLCIFKPYWLEKTMVLPQCRLSHLQRASKSKDLWNQRVSTIQVGFSWRRYR